MVAENPHTADMSFFPFALSASSSMGRERERDGDRGWPIGEKEEEEDSAGPDKE